MCDSEFRTHGTNPPTAKRQKQSVDFPTTDTLPHHQDSLSRIPSAVLPPGGSACVVTTTTLSGEGLDAALVCSWRTQPPEKTGGSGGEVVMELGTVCLTAAEIVSGKFDCNEECWDLWNGELCAQCTVFVDYCIG